VERSEGDRWVKINSSVGGINQDITDEIVAGKDYQVSATTQLSELGTNGYIGVRFATETGELVDLQYVRVTSDTLELQELEFTAPEKFARAEIFGFKNEGSAAFFVDDFSLSEIGNGQIAEESNEIAAEENTSAEVAEIEDSGVEIFEPENSTDIEENFAPSAVATEEVSETDSATDTIVVNNSSFSDELSGWNSGGENISVVERSEGDRWVEINSAEGGISQDVTEQIVAGEDYYLSATAQLSELGTNGYIGVRFTTETNELIDLPYTRVTGNTLEVSELQFTAPEEFAQAEIFGYKNDGSAAFYVDDFALTQSV
jgi:hypothetical protein